MNQGRDALINLPPDAELVTDPDEEIFLLYTALRGAPTDLVGPDGFRGLGHIDSRQDTLSIDITLRRPPAHDAAEVAPSVTQASDDAAAVRPDPPRSATAQDREKGRAKKRRVSRQQRRQSSKKHSQTGGEEEEEIVKTFTLAQDKTALRSRSGDTGSVLWRASFELARVILQQDAFPPANARPLFSRAVLANAHVLELGAGTGLLGAALSPLVRTYTLTDVPALLPLLRKNVALNLARTTSDADSAYAAAHSVLPGNVAVEPLDWEVLRSLPAARRAAYLPTPPDLTGHHDTAAGPCVRRVNARRTSSSFDEQHVHADRKHTLVLAVDCIYHPSLLPALVDTLCSATPPGAWALVLAELRAEDVLREFLARWLASGSSSGSGPEVAGESGTTGGECGGWRIWSLRGVVGVHYALWVGMRLGEREEEVVRW